MENSIENFFQNRGIQINGITHLSPKEAWQASQEGAVMVDIREEFELLAKIFDVSSVLYIPNSSFMDNFELLPNDKPLIIADSVGLRSKKVVIFLQENGYANIANLNGGIVDWEKDQLPMTIDKNEMLTGSCLCQLRPKKRFKQK